MKCKKCDKKGFKTAAGLKVHETRKHSGNGHKANGKPGLVTHVVLSKEDVKLIAAMISSDIVDTMKEASKGDLAPTFAAQHVARMQPIVDRMCKAASINPNTFE